MGQTIAKFFRDLFANKEARILLVGLDAAGKDFHYNSHKN
jgi:hypothetical protein